MKLDLRVLLLLLPLSGGCSWLPYAVENMACTPVEWIEECVFRGHMQKLASDAWRQVEHDEGKQHSEGYASGFKAGFVDFIENNATGEPLATPPNKLQNAGYRTPKASTEITDWYAGFRHGASVARATGIRERFVIPIGLPPHPVVGEPEPRAPSTAPHEEFPPSPTPVVPAPPVLKKGPDGR